MAGAERRPAGAATPGPASVSIVSDAAEHNRSNPSAQPWSEPKTYTAAARLALANPEAITPAEARFVANLAVQPEWRPVPAGKAARLDGIVDRLRWHVGGGTP